MTKSPAAAGASVRDLFNLTGRVAVITGGAGFLGVRHAEAVAEMGGVPVLVDLDGEAAQGRAAEISTAYGCESVGLEADIRDENDVRGVLKTVLDRFGRADILINNAANNPKVEGPDPTEEQWTRLESLSIDVWNQDLAVGLTGAFLCSRAFGTEMARRGSGVILNIASDLAIIAPDQRIYRKDGVPAHRQPVKPVSYSVVKAGLIGLTRYLATYWSDSGVRANALVPGGVFNNQDEEFVQRLTDLIPMGRMAHADEYKAAIVFLVSDASSYMTGANLVIDGGRTTW